MTPALFVSVLCLTAPPIDAQQLLREAFDRRANANVALTVSLTREEVLTAGKVRKTRLKLRYARYMDQEYCELDRDQDGEKYGFKLCKGCYAPDKDRVLIGQKTAKGEPMFLSRSNQEANKPGSMFDLRQVGFDSFVTEGVTTDRARPYTLDLYEKPKVNNSLSSDGITCVELANVDKTGAIRYFINTQTKRLEKLTQTDTEFDSNILVQSTYASDADLFPARIRKTITRGQYRLTEDAEVTDVRFLTKADNINWSPDLVDLHKNTILSGTKLIDKRTVQSGLFYDGKVLREPTMADFDKYGKVVEPAENLPADNARTQGGSYYLYLIPVAFFTIAAVLFVRTRIKRS